MTREELAGKVDWEGGVSEAITGYGMSTRNLPDDAPEAVRSAWQRVYDMASDIELIEHWLETGDVRGEEKE
jgi:hypothetical protein